MGLLDETIGRIHPLAREAVYKAQKRWDDLYLGVGDLGKLEEMVVQYAGVTGEVLPEIPKCCMVVACADHGVYRQKVSAYPQSTTVGMVKSYVDVKGASANALAHYCGAHMVVVDMGINADMSDVPGLLHRKIAFGTKDITEGAAMSRAEAIHAIEAGIEIAENKIKEGYRVFTVGEMGIANTTASACILGALTGGMLLRLRGVVLIFPMPVFFIKLRWCKKHLMSISRILLTVWMCCLKLEVLNSGV